MTFSSLLSSHPHPFDVNTAQDLTTQLHSVPQEVKTFLANVGSCSPYLKGSILGHYDWLLQALDDGEAAIMQEFERLALVPPDQIAKELRVAKGRIALITALYDIAGIWPVMKVTGHLTEFADLSVSLALQAALRMMAKRKKLPGLSEDDDLLNAGLFVLGMGKMGAYELNYSSDIDLICLFDEARIDLDDFHDMRAGFIRATKMMSATLNDLTADGYVFRTDLRLRPDSGVTPVCMGVDAAERYYEALGRTWERAAYIKARVSAGDQKAGQAFLKTLTPFVWRKHLDFAAIEDAHNMRLAIRQHKGLGGKFSIAGHDVKLGRGGIREIEFFTQTRQLIAGGRDPDLRVRGTLEGLDVLSEKGWVSAQDVDRLKLHYQEHRVLEHRIQMINDAQTHTLPSSQEGLDRLAAFLGQSRADMTRDIQNRCDEVEALTEGFFAPQGGPQPVEISTQEKDVISRWPSYPSLRSERALAIFERLQPKLIERIRAADVPHEALMAFDKFLEGLPAGVQLFSLFEANTHLIDLLIDICGTSPELSKYIARNSQVLDAVIGGGFWEEWKGRDLLTEDLSQRLQAEPDYERKLDLTRRWGKEWHFRIGVHYLRGIISSEQAAEQYADLAQATLASLWPEVVTEFSRKHGPAPGRGAVVIGMGSLGAGRMSSTSDLDLIVVYDAQGQDMSDGKRPLATRPYYARLTQALITAMTAPMAEGRLYEVDMRLRPSGNQGPVATSFDSFKHYQTQDAWAWEHLALTRAKCVAGPSELASDIEEFRISLLGHKTASEVRSALSEMRQKITDAKGHAKGLQVKTGSGRLQDIELISQMGALLGHVPKRDVGSGLEALVGLSFASQGDIDELNRIYQTFWTLQLASKLLGQDLEKPQELSERAVKWLLGLVKCRDLTSLQDKVTVDGQKASDTIDRILAD